MTDNHADIIVRNNLLGFSPRMLRNFYEKIIVSETGCWLWQAACTDTGYGMFQVDYFPEKAHRVAYRLVVGPIEDGKQLHHKCEVRRCVNPEHLEQLSPKEHGLKTVGCVGYQMAELRAASHCVNGHEWNEENTGKRTQGERAGERYCKACDREKWAERHKKYRDENPVHPKTHCHMGHEFTEENTFYKVIRGYRSRQCLQCRRERERITSKSHERKEWLNRYRREKRAKAKADRLKPSA